MKILESISPTTAIILVTLCLIIVIFVVILFVKWLAEKRINSSKGDAIIKFIMGLFFLLLCIIVLLCDPEMHNTPNFWILCILFLIVSFKICFGAVKDFLSEEPDIVINGTTIKLRNIPPFEKSEISKTSIQKLIDYRARLTFEFIHDREEISIETYASDAEIKILQDEFNVDVKERAKAGRAYSIANSKSKLIIFAGLFFMFFITGICILFIDSDAAAHVSVPVFSVSLILFIVFIRELVKLLRPNCQENKDNNSINIQNKKLSGQGVLLSLLGIIASTWAYLHIVGIPIFFLVFGANFNSKDESGFTTFVGVAFLVFAGIMVLSDILLAIDLISKKERRFIKYIFFPPSVFLTLFSNPAKNISANNFVKEFRMKKEVPEVYNEVPSLQEHQASSPNEKIPDNTDTKKYMISFTLYIISSIIVLLIRGAFLVAIMAVKSPITPQEYPSLLLTLIYFIILISAIISVQNTKSPSKKQTILRIIFVIFFVFTSALSVFGYIAAFTLIYMIVNSKTQKG
jgi:hypothetical protein